MDDLIAQNFAKLMQANQENDQMAIKRLNTGVEGEQAPHFGGAPGRGLTQKVMKQAAPGTQELSAPVFGAGRSRKKTLVDIEMDADSDLEEFERNQVDKLRGSAEDDPDAGTELGRQATQLDKKPGSLESASEVLSRDVDDLADDRSAQLRREDTEIEKVPAENSEAPP